MSPTKESWIAWAAGIFEGEGCVTVGYTVGGRPKVRLRINMTDGDVLERFAAVVGGHVCGPYERGDRKPAYYWQLGGYAHLKRIYSMFVPYLGARRTARFQEVLALEPSPDHRPGHAQRDKTHCKRGHEFTPENTLLHTRRAPRRPGRVCRTCRNEQQRARRAEAKR